MAAAVVMQEVQVGTAGSAPGTVRVASRGGGLADLVADAEMEKVSSPGPPPPVSSRMLRVEVRGLLHDWFDVGEMGDFIRSPEFAGTLRENVARYFSVPFERQAIYDEDGLLTSTADFSRALQKLYPKLFIYDLDEMGPELRARAVDELRQIDADVEQSWKQFGTKQPMRTRQTWQDAAGTSSATVKPQDVATVAYALNGDGIPTQALSPEVRELSGASSTTQTLQPRVISRGQADVQACTPTRSAEHIVPVRSTSPRIIASHVAVPPGAVAARMLEQSELRSISPRILTAAPSTSLPQRTNGVASSPRLAPMQQSPLRPVELHAYTPRTQPALSATPMSVPTALTPRGISPRMQCRSASPCILPDRPSFSSTALPQGCSGPCPSPQLHAAWLDQLTPRRSLTPTPAQPPQASCKQGGLPPPPGISFTLKPELPRLQLQPISLMSSVSTPQLLPVSPRVPGLCPGLGPS
ncbi:hypothetical protein AK812_SmicGene32166 [Symbiodinium microadriaticum]|uniref:Uncharacterized protein n=1 Tax=Symbiodinium microadriaticum TaxID=2951 RepID=A0A1Q9CUW4_SYMMI|nr:hypothetical protein AK812_SmicGene32166 [Symbiodinium microadriaticum]CAE7832933.1 unnamed protein product [Symbiodinium microadriaticum]